MPHSDEWSFSGGQFPNTGIAILNPIKHSKPRLCAGFGLVTRCILRHHFPSGVKGQVNIHRECTYIVQTDKGDRTGRQTYKSEFD